MKFILVLFIAIGIAHSAPADGLFGFQDGIAGMPGVGNPIGGGIFENAGQGVGNVGNALNGAVSDVADLATNGMRGAAETAGQFVSGIGY